MKMLGHVPVWFGGMLAVAIWLPGAANATPNGGWPVNDTIQWLQDRGYSVALNGPMFGNLSRCVTTGVYGMRDSNIDARGLQIDSTKFGTVYVDVSSTSTD